jgi:gamma-glutamyltranspeptidase / glutathione hydrolase
MEIIFVKLKRLNQRNLRYAAFILVGLTVITLLMVGIYPPPKKSFHLDQPAQRQWGVSSGHPLATQAGLAILAQGGNAVDASVAIAYALGVVEPYATGLGGGGEMVVYWKQSQQVKVIDYRETAPHKGVQGERRFSPLTIGLPGLVKGLEYVRQKYGTLPRSILMAPAIHLAETGFPVNKTLARFLVLYDGFKITRQATPLFFHGKRLLHPGELLCQEALARQLTSIAEGGANAFYDGPTAQLLCRAINAFGDPMTPGDLQKYQVRETPPAIASFLNYRIAAPPPPGGGTTLLEMLRLAEKLGAMRPGLKEEFRLKLLEKAITIAYQDRFRYLGDAEPAFPQPPKLFGENYLTDRLKNSANSGNWLGNDNEQTTTHFVVVDQWGNWVSSTQTISNFFGSGVYINGFFLNDSLTKFSDDPNSPNRIGNAKRPFSYMAPCIIFKDEHPVLALGTPGGRRIPAILLQTLTHYLIDGQTLAEAVAAPRFYLSGSHELCFEKTPFPAVTNNLKKYGLRITLGESPISFGSIQALAIDERNNQLIGAADSRREGNFIICRP